MPDRIITSDPVSEYRTSINELFASGTLAARPAASAVPGGRYLDEFGTEWRSDGTDWRAVGGKMPYCSLSQSGTESVPNDTAYDLTWHVEDADTWGMHAAFADAIVLPYAGNWLALLEVDYAAGTSGSRRAYVSQGGVAQGEVEMTTAIGATLQANALLLGVAAGTTIKGTVRHVSGAAMNIRGTLRVQMLSS